MMDIRVSALVAAMVMGYTADSGAQNHQICDTKKYAQYEDNAKTYFGRYALALDYCRMVKSATPSTGVSLSYLRQLEECHRERSKIADALRAAKDYKMVQWLLDGCTGELPPDTASKSAPTTPPK